MLNAYGSAVFSSYDCGQCSEPESAAEAKAHDQEARDLYAKLIDAYSRLAAERDEWKRRAEALGYQGGK